MKKLLIFIVLFLLLTVSFVIAKENNYDNEGNLIPSPEVKALFRFPGVGVGSVYDIPSHKVVSTINVEVLDTNDSTSLIPLNLKIKRMPSYMAFISDVGVGDGLVMMGFGVRFLPILEPGVLLFGGYNFNEGQEAYGVAARFGIKF